jgi:hypothetical protein
MKIKIKNKKIEKIISKIGKKRVEEKMQNPEK